MPLLEMAPILDDFDRSTVSVTTYGATTVDALGRTIPGTASTANRNPVVHVTSQRELQLFPEAVRPREAITIYDTIAYGSPETTLAEVIYQGRLYRVLHTADYQEHGSIFYMIAELVD